MINKCQEISIESDYYPRQVLKTKAATGGQAKWFCQEEKVLVKSGSRKHAEGAKLYPGDQVTVPGF